MSHLEYSAYPGYGEIARKDYSYSQAVRIGDTLHCSAQGENHFVRDLEPRLNLGSTGGWDAETGSKFEDSVGQQNDQAFKNVELAVKHAGSQGWNQVGPTDPA